MDGFLLVDKPVGWTSHDVVAKIRGILATESRIKNSELRSSIPNSSFPILNSRGSKIRVGHTGTLDPAATGLLILVLGSWTRRAEQFSRLDKVYEAEIKLGATSSTGDREGEITEVEGKQPSTAEVQKVLKSFIGEQNQTPPAYSAIKVGGQPAYKQARAGQSIELEPRRVTIYDIYDVEYAYPRLSFSVKVSSGTYIRSLAEDIGQKLGTGAYLAALRRTQVGNFNVSQAIKLQPKLDFQAIQQHLRSELAFKE